MTKLADKVLVTTGGTQGIGAAIALHAAEHGAAGVVITGRQADKGQAVVDQIQALGSQGLFVPADLSSVDDCRQVIHQCDAKFGRVDALVNAAADTNRGTLEDTTPEFWDYQFHVNVRAPFLLCQEAVRLMRRDQRGGGIVNILSVAAYCGLENLLSYSSTKGALTTMTKNLAIALRRDRIRVNGITLGWTNTPNEHIVQAAQGSPSDWLETAEKESPFGRLIEPDDVARLCMYLLSDESGVVTGSNIDYSQHVMGSLPTGLGRE